MLSHHFQQLAGLRASAAQWDDTFEPGRGGDELIVSLMEESGGSEKKNPPAFNILRSLFFLRDNKASPLRSKNSIPAFDITHRRRTQEVYDSNKV